MKWFNFPMTLLALFFSYQAWADTQRFSAPPPAAGISRPAPGTILAKWAQLILMTGTSVTGTSSTPMVSVRVVVGGSGAPCEGIITDSDGELIIPIAERPNSDPAHFPITVCETLFAWNKDSASPSKETTVTFSDSTRLSWSPQVDSIAIVGDTGCRYPERNQGFNPVTKEGCADSLWLFQRVAREIESRQPNLMLHVGDYRYRGNAKDNVDKKQIYPDTWAHWHKDFFDPAAPLLNKVPWVVARGNHDNCYGSENKGAGWLLLLSPYPSPSDPMPCEENEPNQEKLYALDLDGLRLVVLDTANAVNVRSKWETGLTQKPSKR
jgi:Calcineurin-like phosphoesterase